MENDPFEDVFPIENGDIPLLCLITGVYQPFLRHDAEKKNRIIGPGHNDATEVEGLIILHQPMVIGRRFPWVGGWFPHFPDAQWDERYIYLLFWPKFMLNVLRGSGYLVTG